MKQAAMAFGIFRAAASLAVVVTGFAGVAVWLMMFQERRQQLPLFDPHKAFVQLGMFCKILLGFLRLVMILGVVEHGGTHTVLPLLAHKDLVVNTAFTAGPEVLVLGKLGVGDRLITQFGVDLHDGQARGKSKDLRVGIGLAAELEDLLFDLFGQPALTEVGRYDKPGIGYVFPMAPGFDIAETCPDAVLGKGDHRLAFPHFLLDIVGASFCNTGTPRFCGGLHFVADDLCEILVGMISY